MRDDVCARAHAPQELTPEKVKSLMEEVIRTHLGWLIVWGNVFGSLIGILSVVAGYPDNATGINQTNGSTYGSAELSTSAAAATWIGTQRVVAVAAVAASCLLAWPQHAR